MSTSHKTNAVDVISDLIEANPEITELSVFEPNPTLSVQDRLAREPSSRKLIEEGLKIREQVGLPFWDSVLASCIGVGNAALPVLDEARFHNSPPIRIISIPSRSWSTSYFTDMLANTYLGRILVISSRVLLSNGEHRHIPMLDFHCPPSSENLVLAKRVANLTYPSGGYILQSGKSYHFYGNTLMKEPELSEFLGKALLFSPLIDRAWIAHQLIEGKCGLRISTKADGGDMPYVVARLGSKQSCH